MTKVLTVNDISRFSAMTVLNDKFMQVQKQLCHVGKTLRLFFRQMTRKKNLIRAIHSKVFLVISFILLLIFLPICFKMFYNTVQVPFLLFDWVDCPFEINGCVNWVTTSRIRTSNFTQYKYTMQVLNFKCLVKTINCVIFYIKISVQNQALFDA